jgi:hypothetical protein
VLFRSIASERVLASGLIINTWYHFALVKKGKNWYSYLNGIKTDDFANNGFTHLQTPSGRAMSFKSALKQFNELVKAAEFVTFNKI